MKPGGAFVKMLCKDVFLALVKAFVFDEAHSIVEWGTFRPEYQELSRLHYRLMNVPFVFASATFSMAVLKDIKMLFGLTPTNLVEIHRSNDRPNICVGVRKIVHALSSYKDLAFLVPGSWKEGGDAPPKFVIFFNSIVEAVHAAKYLRNRLPPHLRYLIKWFHADMSEQYKDTTLERLRKGEIWGICATDSFGLVCIHSLALWLKRTYIIQGHRSCRYHMGCPVPLAWMHACSPLATYWTCSA